jgi:hypothetical protein
MKYLEELKTYRKLKNKQKEKNRLYAIIMKYLSEESLNGVKRVKERSEIEEEVDTERLWKVIVDKHRVHLMSEVAAVIKLEAQNQVQTLRQGGFESLTSRNTITCCGLTMIKGTQSRMMRTRLWTFFMDLIMDDMQNSNPIPEWLVDQVHQGTKGP